MNITVDNSGFDYEKEKQMALQKIKNKLGFVSYPYQFYIAIFFEFLFATILFCFEHERTEKIVALVVMAFIAVYIALLTYNTNKFKKSISLWKEIQSASELYDALDNCPVPSEEIRSLSYKLKQDIHTLQKFKTVLVSATKVLSCEIDSSSEKLSISYEDSDHSVQTVHFDNKRYAMGTYTDITSIELSFKDGKLFVKMPHQM